MEQSPQYVRGKETDMNRFRSITAGALVAGLLITGIASAQAPRGGGPGRPGGPDGPGRGPGGRAGAQALQLGALNLTDAQKQQIRDIREQERQAGRQLQERLRTANDAQRDAIESVPINEGLIRQAAAALADVQAEAAIQQALVYNQIWAVLTPAQQAQAKKLRAERDVRQEQRLGDRAQRRQKQP
jgi:Spy/CpxP family protein refolding chaperone